MRFLCLRERLKLRLFLCEGRRPSDDWFVKKLYTPKGFFTPPYETAASLRQRLERQYQQVAVGTVEAMACFIAIADAGSK